MSVQPLWAVMRWRYQAEVERVLSPTTTLGFAASHWINAVETDFDSRTSGDVKLRYYPRGSAPEGFSVGAGAGFVRINDERADRDYSDTGYGMGFFLDYAWLFAPARRYYAAVGLGAKLLKAELGPASGELLIPRDRYLTARFSVGFGF